MSAALSLSPEAYARRFPGPARKYFFTSRADALIRQHYHEHFHDRGAIKRLGKELGWPKWMVTKRAAALGLSRIKEPPWNMAEIAIIERHGHKGTEAIRRLLSAAGFARSHNAILLKRKRLLIVANLGGYSACGLAELFGIDGHIITRWIKRKLLEAEHRRTERVRQQGGDSWFIRIAAVKKFIFAYPDEIDLRKVDKWWFLEMVTDGKIRR